MGTREKICGLCLKICDPFEVIEGDIRDALDIVLVQKVDLTAIQEPIMCAQCTKMVIKCFDFKAECLNTYDYLVPFINNSDNVKLDLKDIYLIKNENGTGFSEGQDICGFCMDPVENSSATSFNVEERDVILLKMVEKCLPELDLSMIEKPVICAACHGSLENYFRFVMDCFIVEKKIKKYYETLDKSSRDQIDLSGLLQSTINDVSSSVDVIKSEHQFMENKEDADERKIGDAEEDVDHQNKSFMDLNDLKLNHEEQFSPYDMLRCNEENDNLNNKENLVEVEDQKFLINEETEIKTNGHDFNRFEDVLPQPEVTTRLYRTQKYLMPSKPHIKHTSAMNKCEFCSYQTKSKIRLKTHLLVHNRPLGVTMYKCDSCLYETRYQSNLKRHLLKHKNPSEVTMYKCEFCSYQTKNKSLLRVHLLKHKNPSEVTIYKCESCSFQTRVRRYLKRHSLIHKSPLEITMYKCDSCSYSTKTNSSLTKHLLVHKDPSEVTMYRCDSCLYQTKYKENLKRHALMHKDPSEITMYKCDCCSYETGDKSHLKNHFLKHKNPSEVTMFKCDSCSYQTKHKIHLKTHFLKHRNPSQVTAFKCDSCSYQAKYKSSLKSHLLKHKNPSEVTTFKCDSCSYQTKYKTSLKIHLLKHKNPSEVSVHKCDSCSYQTIQKYNLNKHTRVNHRKK